MYNFHVLKYVLLMCLSTPTLNVVFLEGGIQLLLVLITAEWERVFFVSEEDQNCTLQPGAATAWSKKENQTIPLGNIRSVL